MMKICLTLKEEFDQLMPGKGLYGISSSVLLDDDYFSKVYINMHPSLIKSSIHDTEMVRWSQFSILPMRIYRFLESLTWKLFR